MRQFCTIAVATSLLLATASTASAAIITDDFVLGNNITSIELNNGTPITIDGFGDFNIFYNFRTDRRGLQFDSVFGDASEASGVSFDSDFGNAASQAVRTFVAGDGVNFFPGGESFRLGWIFDNVTSSQIGGFAVRDDSSSDNDGRLNAISNIDRSNNFGNTARVGFLTFRESPQAVPTPALLPGLIGLGFSAIRKRNLAQSDEA